eukprot:133285-Prorocentrum_lima.AAC.1
MILGSGGQGGGIRPMVAGTGSVSICGGTSFPTMLVEAGIVGPGNLVEGILAKTSLSPTARNL